MNVAACLVLNSTYEPLNVTSIARAVRLVFSGKAEIVRDAGTIASPSFEMALPSIVRMLYFIRRARKRVALTKKNVLLRDDFVCQYCGMKGGREMTVDHVVPRSAGGKSTWENLACACANCNGRKRDRTPGQARMPLRRPAREPFHIPFVSLYSVGIEERVR